MKPITTYVLELTKACNEHCPFCYSMSYSPIGERRPFGVLAGDQWISALEHITAAGAQAVDFSGGEPTLHKEFPRIIGAAKDLGLYTIVSTNGSQLVIPDVREALATADCVALSIHASTPAKHDTIKGRSGSYRDVNVTYEYLLGMTVTRVKVNTVACRQNLDDLLLIGDNLGIENTRTIWKISQIIPREAGRVNKDVLSISDGEFQALEHDICERYPRAHEQGRLVFRDDDSDKYACSPYVLVRSDGHMFVPSGTAHRSLQLSVLDQDLVLRVAEQITAITGQDFAQFVCDLQSTHDRSYKN